VTSYSGRSVDTEALAKAIRAGERAGLARAITLVESTRAEHREAAQRLLLELTPDAGGANRVGITGVPGVGKSTFIDALGMLLIEQGHRVAVLAVDPSSTRTGGSILGDKTRMARLSVEQNAYIRRTDSTTDGRRRPPAPRHRSRRRRPGRSAGLLVVRMRCPAPRGSSRRNRSTPTCCCSVAAAASPR